MFGGGYPDEDDDEDQQPHPPTGAGRGAGPSAMLANLMGGGGMGWAGQPVARAPPRAYDEYFKAYSVAMLPGRERANLSYGGKIIMPQSALANLTNLDVEPPWMFQLRNPSNPAASTHAGVMEFIAQEGCVHLPYWMMKTLRLEEGDPIRITGAKLPGGKLIKIQPQQLHFLEISDPKALLEQALRNFTCLTAGDVIELAYNSMVLDFLIMDIQPPGPGISVIDTDLEVDFAAPKGYVEPARPAPAPAETMASKLKIDLSSSTPGSSRPTSALGGVPATNNNSEFESFKGLGNTLNGRKTKGKGKSVRKVQPVDPDSKIYRTDKPTMMTNELLGDARPAPAPLTLPFGKLFFGFTVVPYKAPDTTTLATSQPPVQTPAFSGGPGNTLSGRAPRAPPVTQPSASSAPTVPSVGKQPAEDKWKGKGNTLSGAAAPKGRRPPRSPSPEYIEIDSD
ncbi:ubiquitin fusion degradation protein [Tulasnella sp. JGI-2019a]|nr:ubiquitin fusion degradation protein [Tulasnella sp. JGI-2019a]KAG9012997.1 ubiquitin fusion degradation protein [Tulasnella sp. JGI-2019a]KAG9036221.1 ubiquitin fusion degradation protein [Tulasnella sp. JGI-2019a]